MISTTDNIPDGFEGLNNLLERFQAVRTLLESIRNGQERMDLRRIGKLVERENPGDYLAVGHLDGYREHLLKTLAEVHAVLEDSRNLFFTDFDGRTQAGQDGESSETPAASTMLHAFARHPKFAELAAQIQQAMAAEVSAQTLTTYSLERSLERWGGIWEELDKIHRDKAFLVFLPEYAPYTELVNGIFDEIRTLTWLIIPILQDMREYLANPERAIQLTQGLDERFARTAFADIEQQIPQWRAPGEENSERNR
ncbi:MAG: hypothetical protein J0L97_09335 [Alphaproteobacteria bacterium]|nr:hypothetical protein [Alphaproteobacteria bacterium]